MSEDLIRRSDAIEAVRTAKAVFDTTLEPYIKPQDAVDALSALPSAEAVIHGRLIDADALSEKLCETTIFIKDGEVFQRMVNDAPTVSAEAVRGWIPVSDWLPEDIKPVIITWKNTDPASYYRYIVGKHFIGTGNYCNGKWYWYSSVCEDLLAEYGKSDIDEVDEAIEVVAWMPLPEPYEGGDSE